MTIEEILKEWDIDSEMDDNHIDNESIKVPKLHAKYIRHLIQAKLKNTKIQNEFNLLKKTKFRYYRGELSRDELTELNWQPDYESVLGFYGGGVLSSTSFP